jgi:hypothetical protein
VLGRGLANRRHEGQTEEVPEAHGDVARQRLPHLGLQVDGVLVLEQGDRLRIVTVARGLRRTPLAAHPLDDVGDERLDGQVAAAGERVEGHLDRVVDDPAGPHLARRELLQDVQTAHVLGRARVPPAPRAIVVVEVPPPTFLEGVVPTTGPGKLVGEVGHRRHCRTA